MVGNGNNRHQQRQNKALHPTAYSSIHFVRRSSSLHSLRFRRRVSLSLGRSARLGRNCKVQNGVRCSREVPRSFVPQSRAVFTWRWRSVSCLQVLAAHYFPLVVAARLAFCWCVGLCRKISRCFAARTQSRFPSHHICEKPLSAFSLALVSGKFARFLLCPRFRVSCFVFGGFVAVLVATSTCTRYNFNSKAARLNNCAPTRRCTRPPTAPFVPHFASGGG